MFSNISIILGEAANDDAVFSIGFSDVSDADIYRILI